jgi:hypothetical protein
MTIILAHTVKGVKYIIPFRFLFKNLLGLSFCC